MILIWIPVLVEYFITKRICYILSGHGYEMFSQDPCNGRGMLSGDAALLVYDQHAYLFLCDLGNHSTMDSSRYSKEDSSSWNELPS